MLLTGVARKEKEIKDGKDRRKTVITYRICGYICRKQKKSI